MPESFYYIQLHGKEVGPLSFSQMRSLWSRAEITVRDSFRYENESLWRPVALLQRKLDEPSIPPPLPAPAKTKEPKAKKRTSTVASGCGCLFLGLAILFIVGVANSPKSGPNKSSISVPMTAPQKFEGAAEPVAKSANAEPEKEKRVKKSTSSSGSTIQGENWFGASSKETFEKLISYAVQKDEVAFKKAMSRELLQGEATFFKDGEKVIVTDTAIFSGLVRIRRPGEETEFWTNLEAVKN